MLSPVKDWGKMGSGKHTTSLVWHAVLCYGNVIYYISGLVVFKYVEGLCANNLGLMFLAISP